MSERNYYREAVAEDLECPNAGTTLDFLLLAQEALTAERARAEAAEREREELAALIAYIDAHAPRADATCDEPGITLSEAARRAIAQQNEEVQP